MFYPKTFARRQAVAAIVDLSRSGKYYRKFYRRRKPCFTEIFSYRSLPPLSFQAAAGAAAGRARWHPLL
jgi:hypothetical protein